MTDRKATVKAHRSGRPDRWCVVVTTTTGRYLKSRAIAGSRADAEAFARVLVEDLDAMPPAELRVTTGNNRGRSYCSYLELLDYLAARLDLTPATWAGHYFADVDGPHVLTARQVAERTGRCRRTVARWKAANAIPLHVAEDIADVLHEHPALIWPAWPELVLATAS